MLISDSGTDARGESSADGQKTRILTGDKFFNKNLIIAGTGRLGIDFILYQIILASAFSSNAAQIISFWGSATLLLFYHLHVRNNQSGSKIILSYFFISLLVFFFRGGLFGLAINEWGMTPRLAVLPAAVGSVLIFYVGEWLLSLRRIIGLGFRHQNSDLILIALALYLFFLRLVYIGQIGLIPEETYYWNYSQHPDWGYLDHPPMVAWIIKLGTVLFGQTEFGVRFGAFISWIVAAWFIYLITREWFGRKAASTSLLLLAVLPFFFGIGAITTPDAPLTACWAGGLFFIQRALIGNKKYGWWSAGVCLGLGMLSKYTMALLAPAVLLYLIFEPSSRLWLKRPEPYLALLVAAGFFWPVIYWNSQNGWVSFLFQTSRRIGESIRFSPHLLLGSILVLITPFGLWSAGQVVFYKSIFDAESPGQKKKKRLFVIFMAVVPLAVFFIFSLTHQPKLNWTGPLWLVTIPGISWILVGLQNNYPTSAQKILGRGWVITVAVFILLYGGLLNYMTPGFPGVPYPRGISDVAGWPDLGAKIGIVARQVEQTSGSKPMIVGMDKYNIASELAFYNRFNGPQYTTGAHLFGLGSLMYADWFPLSSCEGKTMIMVARGPEGLQTKVINASFAECDDVRELKIYLNSHEITSYFYRVGYNYHPIEAVTKIYENTFPGNLRKSP